MPNLLAIHLVQIISAGQNINNMCDVTQQVRDITLQIKV